jgi:small-conductance mechanosensitive channel
MNIEHLNAWMNIPISGNTVYAYLRAIVTLAVIFLTLVILHRVLIKHLGKLAKRTATDLDDLMVTLLSRIGNSVFFVFALYFSASSLNLAPYVHSLLHTAVVIVITIRAVTLVQEALRYVLRFAYRRGRSKDDPVIESTVTNLIGVFKWILWIAAFLFILDNLGVNITTMVAGIGITGIAVAMASQAVLGDAFSAFAIFLDKPFEVGDFIIVDTIMGSVEHIGLKTTRIRSLFGEQLVIANSDLTKSRIKNYKRMQAKRGSLNFSMAFNTPVEKLKRVPEVVLTVLKNTALVRADHVHLMNFGSSTLDFEAAYYLEAGKDYMYFDVHQDICLRILEGFAQEGIELAAPAQFIHVKELPQQG